MVSNFKDALNSGRFVITSEIAPPKGTNLEKVFEHIELLKVRPLGWCNFTGNYTTQGDEP